MTSGCEILLRRNAAALIEARHFGLNNAQSSSLLLRRNAAALIEAAQFEFHRHPAEDLLRRNAAALIEAGPPNRRSNASCLPSAA